ncbi:uncharacterized protein LOC142609578 [Castanea sativa]|uniref:uncharacterized protein LOC142609578 n=1 Tax=Castanea sativa TaxID=21020 RepID=UPI003F653496
MELEQVLWLSSGGGGGGGSFSTSQFQGGYAFDHGLQISEATNNSDIQIQQPIKIIDLENDSNDETVTNEGCFDHLTITKTNTFYDLMEVILRFEKNTKCIDETNHSETQAEVRKVSKKLKALNFRASLLKIGMWEEVAEQVEGLIVRCYFAKERLAWEISRKKSVKKKIEIKWSDILAIRAKIMEDGAEVLEIELNRPPSFYEESTPIPRMHTTWNISSDFTGGQALNYRRHYLEFPPGVLEKY